MKKLLVLTLVVAMAFFGTNAFAGAKWDASVGAIGGGFDADLTVIPGVGAAGGIAAGGGIAGAQGKGGIVFGKAGGELSATGGGLANSETFVEPIFSLNGPWSGWTPASITIGVALGSDSQAEGVAAASGKVGVKGFLGAGYTTIGGIGGEFTADASYVSNEFLSFSDGKTYGLAGQGSAGAFAGAAGAATLIGKAKAEVDAEILMAGNSGSSSYRATTIGNGYVTEELGTNVYAGTQVLSSKSINSPEVYLAIGVAGVEGGWIAGGAVKTATIQTNPTGGAYATASGSYHGSGQLGSNYEGSAEGYSRTSNTVVSGMNGSINSASAGMQVTSKITH